MRLQAFSSLILLGVFHSSGRAQEVVSAQSGVIHYLEGAVSVDGVPLERKPATFPLLKNGSVLKTERGRVELMLTPGTFLRLDENSSVKMISSALTSTKLEFVSGSAILDAVAAQGDIALSLQFRDAAINFTKPGLYRIDSETEVLQAYSGEALVKQRDKETRVDTTRLYFFELGTDTKKFSDGTDDEFLDWARNRNEVIAAENQSSQADADDEADGDLGAFGAVPGLNLNAPYHGLNAPYGGLGAVPGVGVPSFGSVYPYGSFFYNSYAPSTLYPLPPLPGPLLVIRRPWAYRAVSPTWPHSGTWESRHSTSTPTWLMSHPVGVYPHTTYVRPLSSPMSRPAMTHPVVVPHAGPAAVHVGHR
jgi:hypothetical protein